MSNKLHIGIVGGHLPPIMGGVETHVWEMSRYLANKGCKVSLFGRMDEKFIKPEYENVNGVDIYRIKKNDLLKLGRISRTINHIKTIYKVHESTPIDILHVHQVLLGPIGLWFKKSKNIPFILTEHGSILNYSQKTLYKPLIKEILKNANYVIAASDELKTKCIQNGCDENKIRTMSNVVDVNRFDIIPNSEKIKKELGIGSDEKVVLSLRRLVPKTGVQYLIEAARKVIVYYDKVKFLIIGDGPLRSELESKVRISKLEKYFIFKGTIPNTEVQRYINIADFSVFPSLAEATSIAALEVMSCGKPVVSSNVGGLPEIIKNEYNGILVDFIKTDSDYSDYGLSKEVIDKLADAIIYMLKEDEKRIEMGQNARNFVVNNNSWESYVNKILEVYNIFK